MLPPQTLLRVGEALEDRVVTRQETTQIVTSVFNSVAGAIVSVAMFAIFYKAIGDNPSSNPSMEAEAIVERAHLKPYEAPPVWAFEEKEEPRKRKPPAAVRSREIGSYLIRMESRDDSCTIKLYEYLEGWKRKLRGTWSGIDKYECDKKFEEVVGVVHQVRMERMTQLRRKE